MRSTYRAPWWLPGGHLQTIVAALRPPPRPQATRARWDTPDGDFIDVDFVGSSNATRALVQRGHRVKNLSGGYLTYGALAGPDGPCLA